ncbi:unnamed protein product [Miscanthus lutarioriparius]|uniref:Uncharacterized protein n=1 Tax=Miscanthus lutarioriparius TaxID=422564 RepID=A0A811Q5I4_9POAL|nr:unnamed protein product [Miscanthus lutarioriparius]
MTKFDPQNRMEQLGKERRIDNKNGLVPIMEQDIKLAITRKYAGVLLLRLHNSGYGLPGVYQENSSMGWVWSRSPCRSMRELKRTLRESAETARLAVRDLNMAKASRGSDASVRLDRDNGDLKRLGPVRIALDVGHGAAQFLERCGRGQAPCSRRRLPQAYRTIPAPLE